MKKTRILCLILCLLLALQSLPASVLAADGTTGETSASETAEPSVPATETPAQIPGQTIGDASITSGCKTIEAQKPLITNDTLLKTAKAAFLYERNTGTLLYSKNPDTKLFPASLTKVMTCMLVLENLTDLSEVITVSESALENMDPDGSTINLQPGEEISVENLLYALMVSSANDAGAVLAERVAGTQEAFVEKMNQRAKELGCINTHFANAHGLHDENHYSSARDLAKISMAATQSELFRKFDSTPRYVLPATNLSEERQLFTTNFMIGDDRIDTFYDEYVTGGKTGFTTPAGRCLMCTAERDGMSLISVVLGAQEEVMDDGYTTTYYGNFEETGVLLELGYKGFVTRQITMDGQSLQQFPVTDGKNDITAGPASEAASLLPVEYTPDDLTIQCELSSSTLKAPVAEGELIGICRVWFKDICLAQMGLLSLSQSDYRILGSNIFSESELQRENLGKILKTAGIVFLVLVALMLVITLITGIRNAVLRAKRRRRRNERRKQHK